MGLRRQRQDIGHTAPWELAAGGPKPPDFLTREQVAMKAVWDLAQKKVRPMSWPEKTMADLERVSEKEQTAMWCLSMIAYHELDLGMVESALERFLKVARSPVGDTERYITCSGEVGFLLAAYYGEQEAGRNWLERFMALAETWDVASYWRWRWAVERDGESKAAFLEAIGRSGESWLGEWVEMAELGDWEEELDPEMPAYLRARVLEPPGS